MPWSPPDSPEVVRDARLDPYRERGGLLFRGADRVATVYIRVEAWWTKIGGHLWWRRWSTPKEGVHGFLIEQGGAFDDFLLDSEDLEDELVDWHQGRFWHCGESYQVLWLDDDASQRIRVEMLGLDPLDE